MVSIDDIHPKQFPNNFQLIKFFHCQHIHLEYREEYHLQTNLIEFNS